MGGVWVTLGSQSGGTGTNTRLLANLRADQLLLHETYYDYQSRNDLSSRVILSEVSKLTNQNKLNTESLTGCDRLFRLSTFL